METKRFFALSHFLRGIISLTSLIFLILTGILFSCKKEVIPALTTTEITMITASSAVSGGSITDDGGDEIISRGVCWNTSGNPTIADTRTLDGTGTGTFESSLTYLMPNTYYYIRAYATNKAGTGYGNELTFATPDLTTGYVNDIDGNTYKTIKIGSQIWFAENLKTTRYNDNTTIPIITGDSEWSSLSSPGYCWYNNDASMYKSTYGALYNWYTVSTRKLCPIGWHVPTRAQWSSMADYLGGETAVRDKIKEAGNAHWILPDAGATNESGFTALPGGSRINGVFGNIGTVGVWWSSTTDDAGNALCLELDDDILYLIEGASTKNQGFSVRCIKD
jgi:uncharacterized protein (TIGR02145 family)